MRYFIPILGLFAWMFLVKSCVVEPTQTTCCSTEATIEKSVVSTAVTPTTKNQMQDPILFNWSKCTPVTTPRFPAYRDSLIALAGKSRRLQIWGQHFTGESQSRDCLGIDLGMARAQNIKNLFASHIDPARIQLGSKRVKNVSSEQKSSLFKSAYFDWVTHNKSVKEIDNKALIYFKYSTSQKLSNKDIDNYLSDVAAQVKKSGERITLVGHTDSDGGSASNIKLGQRRADAIKQILVSKGVSANKIVTSSKGESNPIATNSTPDGRQKNRRTELKIIK